MDRRLAVSVDARCSLAPYMAGVGGDGAPLAFRNESFFQYYDAGPWSPGNGGDICPVCTAGTCVDDKGDTAEHYCSETADCDGGYVCVPETHLCKNQTGVNECVEKSRAAPRAVSF